MKTPKLIALTALLALTGGALNAQELGGVTPSVDAGKLSLGGAWSYGEMKIKDSGCTGTDCDYKVKANHIYAQADWGFSKTWAGYARVGAADLKDEFDNKVGFGPFIGAGAGGAVFSSGAFSTGPAFQLNYFFAESRNYSNPVFNYKLSVRDHWNGSIGWGFEGKWDAVALYGGPQLYREEFKSETKNLTLGTTSTSDTQKSKDTLGAYAGVRFTPAPNWRLKLETNYRSGFGAAFGASDVF